jgi:RNA polymerase sigma-70 factor (ECF subfamily)
VVADHSDADIIAASLEDAAAFGELFERHHQSIFKYVARRADPAAAGDIAADVFTTAFSLRHRYDLAYDNARPWLYGIARNLLRDVRRGRGRASAAYVRLAVDAETTYRSPEAETEARLGVEALERALKKLHRRDAEALLMYAVEGMEYAEIAEVLEIKLGTVKSSINRARKKIGELVATDRPTTEWGSDERGDPT